tara:strand:+ start:198 stop:488 length:291 start_codon:yes stop_codon:yes gene_type:complete
MNKDMDSDKAFGIGEELVNDAFPALREKLDMNEKFFIDGLHGMLKGLLTNLYRHAPSDETVDGMISSSKTWGRAMGRCLKHLQEGTGIFSEQEKGN